MKKPLAGILAFFFLVSSTSYAADYDDAQSRLMSTSTGTDTQAEVDQMNWIYSMAEAPMTVDAPSAGTDEEITSPVMTDAEDASTDELPPPMPLLEDAPAADTEPLFQDSPNAGTDTPLAPTLFEDAFDPIQPTMILIPPPDMDNPFDDPIFAPVEEPPADWIPAPIRPIYGPIDPIFTPIIDPIYAPIEPPIDWIPDPIRPIYGPFDPIFGPIDPIFAPVEEPPVDWIPDPIRPIYGPSDPILIPIDDPIYAPIEPPIEWIPDPILVDPINGPTDPWVPEPIVVPPPVDPTPIAPSPIADPPAPIAPVDPPASAPDWYYDGDVVNWDVIDEIPDVPEPVYAEISDEEIDLAVWADLLPGDQPVDGPEFIAAPAPPEIDAGIRSLVYGNQPMGGILRTLFPVDGSPQGQQNAQYLETIRPLLADAIRAEAAARGVDVSVIVEEIASVRVEVAGATPHVLQWPASILSRVLVRLFDRGGAFTDAEKQAVRQLAQRIVANAPQGQGLVTIVDDMLNNPNDAALFQRVRDFMDNNAQMMRSLGVMITITRSGDRNVLAAYAVLGVGRYTPQAGGGLNANQTFFVTFVRNLYVTSAFQGIHGMNFGSTNLINLTQIEQSTIRGFREVLDWRARYVEYAASRMGADGSPGASDDELWTAFVQAQANGDARITGFLNASRGMIGGGLADDEMQAFTARVRAEALSTIAHEMTHDAYERMRYVSAAGTFTLNQVLRGEDRPDDPNRKNHVEVPAHFAQMKFSPSAAPNVVMTMGSALVDPQALPSYRDAAAAILSELAAALQPAVDVPGGQVTSSNSMQVANAIAARIAAMDSGSVCRLVDAAWGHFVLVNYTTNGTPRLPNTLPDFSRFQNPGFAPFTSMAFFTGKAQRDAWPELQRIHNVAALTVQRTLASYGQAFTATLGQEAAGILTEFQFDAMKNAVVERRRAELGRPTFSWSDMPASVQQAFTRMASLIRQRRIEVEWRVGPDGVVGLVVRPGEAVRGINWFGFN